MKKQIMMLLMVLIMCSSVFAENLALYGDDSYPNVLPTYEKFQVKGIDKITSLLDVIVSPTSWFDTSFTIALPATNWKTTQRLDITQKYTIDNVVCKRKIVNLMAQDVNANIVLEEQKDVSNQGKNINVRWNFNPITKAGKYLITGTVFCEDTPDEVCDNNPYRGRGNICARFWAGDKQISEFDEKWINVIDVTVATPTTPAVVTKPSSCKDTANWDCFGKDKYWTWSCDGTRSKLNEANALDCGGSGNVDQTAVRKLTPDCTTITDQICNADGFYHNINADCNKDLGFALTGTGAKVSCNRKVTEQLQKCTAQCSGVQVLDEAKCVCVNKDTQQQSWLDQIWFKVLGKIPTPEQQVLYSVITVLAVIFFGIVLGKAGLYKKIKKMVK